MRVDPAGPGRVVIDTNVWISGWLSTQGAPAQLTRHGVRHGEPVFSHATFAELQDRLWRPKFDRYLSIELRQRLLHLVDAIAHWVDVPTELAAQRHCRDADDDKFIHAAHAAEARWLVTGDDDLLVLRKVGDTRIVNPRAALSAFLPAAPSRR